MNIALASILTAFNPSTFGSKVVDPDRFLEILSEAISATSFKDQRVPGQAYIPLPAEANATVSAGVGRHTNRAEDYVLREYRGKVTVFLKRELAEPVISVAAVVYTKAAYLSDPDVAGNTTEVKRIIESGAGYVLVAVLASADPVASPLTPSRLVHNLAGGNKEAAEWTADEIRAKAKESAEYYSEWSPVAD